MFLDMAETIYSAIQHGFVHAVFKESCCGKRLLSFQCQVRMACPGNNYESSIVSIGVLPCSTARSVVVAGRIVAEVVLNGDERSQLVVFTRSRSLPHEPVLRAKIVLTAADGLTNTADRREAGKWRRRYLERSIEGIYDDMRDGCPRTYSDEQIAERAIRRGSFLNVKELIAKIESLVTAWNKNVVPFAWYTTADSILAKFARLCEQIFGTGYYTSTVFHDLSVPSSSGMML